VSSTGQCRCGQETGIAGGQCHRNALTDKTVPEWTQPLGLAPDGARTGWTRWRSSLRSGTSTPLTSIPLTSRSVRTRSPPRTSTTFTAPPTPQRRSPWPGPWDLAHPTPSGEPARPGSEPMTDRDLELLRQVSVATWSRLDHDQKIHVPRRASMLARLGTLPAATATAAAPGPGDPAATPEGAEQRTQRAAERRREAARILFGLDEAVTNPRCPHTSVAGATAGVRDRQLRPTDPRNNHNQMPTSRQLVQLRVSP
jgi:hypothetical protein